MVGRCADLNPSSPLTVGGGIEPCCKNNGLLIFGHTRIVGPSQGQYLQSSMDLLHRLMVMMESSELKGDSFLPQCWRPLWVLLPQEMEFGGMAK